MKAAGTSLVSAKFFGYPIYISLAVIFLVFVMLERRMTHVWIWMGNIILTDQER